MAELAARLRQYNRRASEVVRIQLRVALHVGPVGRDSEGLTGQAVIAAARIVDAPAIKARLAAEQADLIFAASDYVYDQVVRNCGGQVDPVAFEHLQCQVKETHVSAWAHLAGRVAPPPGLGVVPPPAPAAAPGPLPVAPPLGKLPPEVRGREGLIAELRRALRPYPRRASRAFVIAGMGGLGKSTVALAAARMARERGYRVWWVRAADSALLTSGMLEVLRELGAPESVTAPVREGARTAPERAWEFLNRDHGAGRRWLLVFDGADNPAVLAGADADTPADGTGWLRADPAGMVIVTTRVRDPQVWGTRVTLRELKPLDDEAGAEVLRDLAPEVADPGGHEARELSRRLGGLPLALHLAGAYLGSPFARWSSFAGYRQALDGVELPAALTDIEEQGADIHSTVQRTWDLSLDALAAEGRPQARPLLLVLSCFAPATPIPAWLLQLPPLAELLAGPGHAGQDNGAERRGLRAGLQGLSRTGLIDISATGSPAGVYAVTVHPVVADANRIRLAASADAERTAVQETVVTLFEAATAGLDPARPGDWPTWRRLRAHMNAAIDLLADDLDPAMLARLLIGQRGRHRGAARRRAAGRGREARPSQRGGRGLPAPRPSGRDDRPRLPGADPGPPRSQRRRRDDLTVSCSPTGSGSRARTTSTPWPPGTTWPPRWACKAATARPRSCTAAARRRRPAARPRPQGDPGGPVQPGPDDRPAGPLRRGGGAEPPGPGRAASVCSARTIPTAWPAVRTWPGWPRRPAATPRRSDVPPAPGRPAPGPGR